jgi:uncharacterized membrane protein
MKSFSINEALSAGWAAFTGRAGFFVGLMLLWGVMLAIPQLILKAVESAPLAIALGLAFQLFQYFLSIGGFIISLKVADGQPAGIGDLFSGGPVFVPYVLGSILYSLLVAVGLVLLVVPGLMAMIAFGYYSLLIIDRGLGPVEALKASAALTQGVRWQLFGFGLVLGLANLLGALLLGLGLLVTAPVSMVAVAHVYRRLSAQTAFS